MDGILLDFTNLDSATKWYLVIAITLTILYAVMRPFRKKKKDPLSYGGQTVGLASQRAVERDMTNLLVQLSEMARQVTAQIDTRAAKLELLIRDADERLALLKEATQETNRNRNGHFNGNGNDHLTSIEVAAASIPSLPAAMPERDSPHVEVYDLADRKMTPPQIALKLGRPQGEIELILALRERQPEPSYAETSEAIKPRKRKKAQ
jgi:hypothetical protein